MQRLEAINIGLAAIGEELAQAEDEGGYYLGLVSGALERKLRGVLIGGFAFNTDLRDFIPTTDGEILLASDEIAVRFPAHLDDRLTIRDGKVWDRQEREAYVEPFRGLVYRRIGFENLPEAFAEWIAREAAVELVYQIDGASNELAVAQQMALDAKARALNTETYTTHDSSGFGRIVAAHNL